MDRPKIIEKVRFKDATVDSYGMTFEEWQIGTEEDIRKKVMREIEDKIKSESYLEPHIIEKIIKRINAKY